MNTYQDSDLLNMGVEYLGIQERGDKLPPLEMFNDMESGSTFIRIPGESIIEARDRIRKGYGK